MTSVFLFIAAAIVASLASLLIVYAKTGEQQTLGGVIAMLALILAALGALARISGI